VPLLPPWSQPARPGGAFSHCLSGALSVSISITLQYIFVGSGGKRKRSAELEHELAKEDGALGLGLGLGLGFGLGLGLGLGLGWCVKKIRITHCLLLFRLLYVMLWCPFYRPSTA
jgi:hypothetical protein